MTRRYPSRHRIEQLFRRAGIPMRLRAETNLSGTICDLVRLGHGVAILNGLSWAGGSHDALQVRPLPPHLANRYGVLRLADRAFSRPAEQLIPAILATLALPLSSEELRV